MTTETYTKKAVNISQVEIEGEKFFKISNCDAMRPFFMSITSYSNHWMFISSNGGLTAGRKNAEHALFPYYTDDKITESAEITGSKTIIRIKKEDRDYNWEPFSERYDGQYSVSRNLYKSVYGNKLRFEEINYDLNLSFSYQWNSGGRFGFIKKSIVKNESERDIHISMLDGLQNIVPAGVGSYLQNQTSNLVDAYKRSELVPDIGLGIYALSATIVDKAEPSEALKANIIWSTGLKNPSYLLSSLQVNKFRNGIDVGQEEDVKAEKGAYFINTEFSLAPGNVKQWYTIADVNKNHSDIVELASLIRSEQNLEEAIEGDIDESNNKLAQLNASADGMQMTADVYRDARHFSNVLFNIMRGGIFDFNYRIEKTDFSKYLNQANHRVRNENEKFIEDLPETFTIFQLKVMVDENPDPDFRRLSLEYMPLKFSRRHGDPSRPWNRFSINTQSEIDGSKILDYEGNWRDIFQNWEALGVSYPAFIESMIHKFLNATTFDGYNPYRVTKDGFDWETIEPDDPWSYIGYWGDHQIIYLLKLLEALEDHAPGQLANYFSDDIFVYANVPYKIKNYTDILSNPKDTVDFDHEADSAIRQKRESIGADGALLCDENGMIHHVNFLEKILATILSKLSNFIPEAGIWMNTQRPEWNDANNALVGNGVSMVTLCYLRRCLKFINPILASSNIESVKVSNELVDFYRQIRETFKKYQPILSGNIDDELRRTIQDELGKAGSDFRWHVYNQGLWGKKRSISLDGLEQFITHAIKFLDHSIEANKRSDNLYHAYNLMTVNEDGGISISHLSEMIEGQVATLSSGYLSSEEALIVLDALKKSALFREDQYSYLLYPNKDLPRFTQKNNIDESIVQKSELLRKMLDNGNPLIIERDVQGKYHFNGNFKNASDVKQALHTLSQTDYAELVERDTKLILQIFEEEFNHKAFTGRSGTFFGYEGLGSIYWHMVSKLQLAVQECCLRAIEEEVDPEIIGRLLEHYYEINEGIGVHKPPSLYGAFPTDPYSHTPAGKGAQQPGMTGQVKEDILCRFGEFGIFIESGVLQFNPCLLRKDEFLDDSTTFHYFNIDQEKKEIQLSPGMLAFTYCQVPIVYKLSDKTQIKILYENGNGKLLDSWKLNLGDSQQILHRSGAIKQIIVEIIQKELK